MLCLLAAPSARRLRPVLVGVLGLTACIYSPLQLTRPGADSGDTTSSRGDTGNGDTAAPGDLPPPADSGPTAQCGVPVITGSETVWQVGNNVVIPRSLSSTVTLTATSDGCDTAWLLAMAWDCGTRSPPCFTTSIGTTANQAVWGYPSRAAPVQTLPAMLQRTPASGPLEPFALTLTFLPTLPSRSRFADPGSTATGDATAPDTPGTFATAQAGYVAAADESFGIYLRRGAWAVPGGIIAAPGTLLVGSFDDRWAYTPCAGLCGGAADFSWAGGAAIWNRPPLACQTSPDATRLDAVTSGNGTAILLFQVDANLSNAPTGFAGLTLTASSNSVTLDGVVDVVVANRLTTAPFVGRDSLLASIDSPAAPLWLGPDAGATAAAVQVDLDRLSLVADTAVGDGPSQLVALNTHLNPGAELTQVCGYLHDTSTTGSDTPIDFGLAWSTSALDASIGSGDEHLAIKDSAVVVDSLLAAETVAVWTLGATAPAGLVGALSIDGSSLAAINGHQSVAVDGANLEGFDVRSTVVHARVTEASGLTIAVQGNNLHAPGTTPFRFDYDTLCTHMPAGDGTAYGLNLVTDDSDPAAPAFFVRNSRVNTPILCEQPFNNVTGSSTGVSVSAFVAGSSLTLGGSIVCAGSLAAYTQRGVVASNAAVSVSDSMIGGAACNGVSDVGAYGVGLDVDAASSLSIERSWIDSGLKAAPFSATQTDAAIALGTGAHLTLTSNVLSASLTLISIGYTWDTAEMDVGYNTTLLSERDSSLGGIGYDWGLEVRTSGSDQIHDNLVVLPSYVASGAITVSALPPSLLHNTYLIVPAAVTITPGGTNAVAFDVPASSVFCTSHPRLSFDAHLSSVATGSAGDALHPIGTRAGYPADIDNQPRSGNVTAPNNYRGADAEANDGCPGRPLVPPEVNATSP